MTVKTTCDVMLNNCVKQTHTGGIVAGFTNRIAQCFSIFLRLMIQSNKTKKALETSCKGNIQYNNAVFGLTAL